MFMTLLGSAKLSSIFEPQKRLQFAEASASSKLEMMMAN